MILNNGTKIPHIGYGTYKLPDDETGAKAVSLAIGMGYRLIDGAAAYCNERAVGEGIRSTGVPRESLFVTSKVWSVDGGAGGVRRSFERSLADLRLGCMDMFLIHWPAVESVTPFWRERNLAAWREMERIADEGLVRAIGVSNFKDTHLVPLMAKANIPPAVDQIEFNPGCQQRDTVGFCRENGILIEAWSPLARGRIFEDGLLLSLARKYGCTPAQICLKWEMQSGVVPIPKSSSPERMLQNLNPGVFHLNDTEMSEINALAAFGQSGLDADTNRPS